ncbi:hypothetical protein [Streptomyces cinnamoneus]|uniref:Uncharacterized protein n=1 Tax=Streptomyces cinnamoneus TaxID=53446 RepID=A0A918U192_STRCJ|nr:hypothetical protein [Streptomyces cinnamoneus]GHC74004.1 hypothetical protein GCM10010507_61640 [Streptomyces cinnamoneus]
MRLFRTVVAAFGGLLLSASLTTGSAVASDGQFVWAGPKGKPYSVQNPPDHKCLDMGQEARAPHNFTKKPLVVYSGKKCKGTATQLEPGRKAGSNLSFGSVIFNP